MKLSIEKICSKYTITKNGDVIRIKSGKKLHQYKDKDGYLQVGLSVCNIQETFKVHRLIGILYIANPENKPEINHINGIKNFNFVDNLEWCTRQENTDHKIKFGLSDRRVMKKTNKTGHVGVSWEKESGKYKVQIQVNKKKISIGRRNKLEDAIFLYDQYVKNNSDEPVEI